MTHLNDCFCDIFAYVLALVETSGPAVGYDKAREDLLGLFQSAETRAVAAGFAPPDIEDAKFAVAAWTDETVLRSNWDGARPWRIAQLQQLFFNTHNAGVTFYEKLGALAATDAPARETFALSLGLDYQGRFFDADTGPELSRTRQEAIRTVVGETLPPNDGGDRPIFPEAYQPAPLRGKRFNPWAFDWWFFLIPLLAAIIAGETYLFMRNDLNIQLLGFFGSLR